jgi:hypothetical protein
LDPALLKAARTEYGLNAINEVLHIVSERNPQVQVHLRHLHQLVIDADGIYNDELAILIAQRKKVDYIHFDAEQQLQNFVNNYLEIIMSSDVQSQQEQEEERKPAPLLDKHRELKKLGQPTTATSSAQKRKADEKSHTSSKSSKKQKESICHSVKDQEDTPTTPTLRSQSAKKGGETATPTNTALRKRKNDGNGETTVTKNSSLFVDAPNMRKIRDGVKRAKEKQAESVNKQRAKKTDKGNRKKVLEGNDICTMTLDPKMKSMFKYLPVMITKVSEGKNKDIRYSICFIGGHLKGTFDRMELHYREGHSAVLHGIDPTKEGFQKNLTLKKVCTLYSNQEHFNCKGNCSLLSRCACKVAGRLCTSLCHGSRGNNKLCNMMDDLDDPYSSDGDDGNEDVHLLVNRWSR